MVKLLLSQITFLIILLAGLDAETNAGYSAKIEGPNVIRNPLVGQTIEIPVFLEKVTEAKGGLITTHYDPTVVEFIGFSPKNFIPGLLALPDTPEIGDDGFNSVKGGGTQLGGTPAKGSGLFGIMSFKLKNKLTTEN